MTTDEPLDRADRALMNSLQADADQSLQEVADACGLSTATAHRRIKRLKAKGYISRTVALADPKRSAAPQTAITEVKMGHLGEPARAAFRKAVAETPEVVQCWGVTGEIDYVLVLQLRDVAHYEEVVNGLLNATGVSTFRSYFVLRRVKFETALPF
ncbi:Lrp/AsnC family transcriptional regulator [Brevundimonas sp. 2R-24]|uniref:Lrp/AsnC family transcriptional regulator n=1 Tax=Peiella sedimenti TaxID=3061083 RepID=A0ABT8SPF2_9CAUL|nr:Lrp/AsnC family transcriptional regulator [Caulobacteraceae bacterium XZ-24]